MPQKIDFTFALERGFHYLIMIITTFVIAFSIWFAYMGIQGQSVEAVKMPVIQNEKPPAQPLPDYMIENLKPDELEQLKP